MVISTLTHLLHLVCLMTVLGIITPLSSTSGAGKTWGIGDNLPGVESDYDLILSSAELATFKGNFSFGEDWNSRVTDNVVIGDLPSDKIGWTDIIVKDNITLPATINVGNELRLIQYNATSDFVIDTNFTGSGDIHIISNRYSNSLIMNGGISTDSSLFMNAKNITLNGDITKSSGSTSSVNLKAINDININGSVVNNSTARMDLNNYTDGDINIADDVVIDLNVGGSTTSHFNLYNLNATGAANANWGFGDLGTPANPYTLTLSDAELSKISAYRILFGHNVTDLVTNKISIGDIDYSKIDLILDMNFRQGANPINFDRKL